jgi:hypothetical protein
MFYKYRVNYKLPTIFDNMMFFILYTLSPVFNDTLSIASFIGDSLPLFLVLVFFGGLGEVIPCSCGYWRS